VWTYRAHARALTAAPAGGKLILPRFGEALTRLSPRGISLSVNGGATSGRPYGFHNGLRTSLLGSFLFY